MCCVRQRCQCARPTRPSFRPRYAIVKKTEIRSVPTLSLPVKVKVAIVLVGVSVDTDLNTNASGLKAPMRASLRTASKSTVTTPHYPGALGRHPKRVDFSDEALRHMGSGGWSPDCFNVADLATPYAATATILR